MLSFTNFDKYGNDFFSAYASYEFDSEYKEELEESVKPKVEI